MKIYTPRRKKFIVNKIVYIIGLAVIVIAGFLFLIKYSFNYQSNRVDDLALNKSEIGDIEQLVEIISGATFGVLMAENNIDQITNQTIYEVAQDVYDLTTIRAGKYLELYFDRVGNDLIRLVYKIDSEDEIIVVKDLSQMSQGDWRAIKQPIPYVVKEKTESGEVKSSMYQAALDNDIDERAIIELADAFQWSIDFAMDPRVGDTFKFVFEERYLEGEYIMPGKILAGQYINAGEKYELFYFEESEENKGYFDVEGNSVQKMFLKAPVAFKYISSGFTTGLRYVQAFDVATGHRAIDYAAATGTPIRAVGDGTVTFAGWSSAGYGYLTSIHHNGTYSTNYGHQSRIIVKYGQKVKQGEVIGYVGSTGFSTGPHLHFEMVKNGVKVNPLREVLPPGKPILEENRERFNLEIDRYVKILEF